MNFRSISDLNRTLVTGLQNIPRDISIIVGVPRSGLLPANILALQLNLPLTDIDGLLAQRAFKGGKRYSRRFSSCDDLFAAPLVIDDSINSGSAMRRTRELLSSSGFDKRCRFAAIYAAPNATELVDFYFEELPQERLFEWNFIHSALLERACLDIDGVICIDPSEQENDDGPCYKTFLEAACPRWLPTVPVGWLVTSRLEKYRSETEKWLKRHSVEYRALIMSPFANREERIRAGLHAEHKAAAYQRTDARVFIESSSAQAGKIAQLSGKPVLCTDVMQMVFPSTANAFLERFGKKVMKFDLFARLSYRFRKRAFRFAPPLHG